MRKLLFALLLLPALLFGQSANDLILTQRKSDNSGSIQRNVTAGASSLLGFSSSTIPVKITIGSGLSFNTSTNTLTASGGGGGGTWGSITGTLADQTDLNTALGLRLLASNNLSDIANAATARSNLGLAIGTNVQAYDADLTTYAGITPSANVQSLLGAANYAAMRTLLDLEAGTDFLAYPTGTPTGSKFLRDDNSWQAIPGGGDALTSSPLSQFAATTSLQLAGVISDETGSGALVFGTSPIFTTNLTLATSTTPSTAAAGAIAFDTDAWGASRGAPQVYDGTANIILIGALASDTPTNGQVPTWNTGGTITWETAGTGNVTNNATLTSGNVVIGGGTTVVGTSNMAWTAGTNTLTVGNLSVTNNATFGNLTTTDLTISGSITGTIGVTNGGTGRATGTTAYSLIATGTTATGAQQTLANGATTEILVGGGASALPVWTTATGSGAPVRATSPTLVTPTLGAATATSINGLTVTTSTGTLTVTNGKTLSVSNTITLAGTDSTTMTFPSTSQTIVGLTATQTLTGKQSLVSGALGTDDTWEGQGITGLNAGATIAQWEAVYLDGSSTWQLADANGSGTFPAVGLAVAAYSSTNAAVVVTHGTVRNDAWTWTPGGVVYLSTTAGGLTQTAPSTSGDKVQQIGRALTADILYVNINNEYLTAQ